MTDEHKILRLACTLQSLRDDAKSEIERRKRPPGGMQAGTPELAMVPMSILYRLERDCQWALMEAGVPNQDLTKWPPPWLEE